MAPIIESRLIYTAGVYKLSDAIRSCRRILITCDLLRFPNFQVYANEKSNPPYYFLGYATLWAGDYVEQRIALEFTEQLLVQYNNPEYQLANLILGVGTNVAYNLQALGAAMTPPAVLGVLEYPDTTFMVCPYTRIKFKLPLGTRIQVTALGFPTETYPGQQASADLSYPTDTVPRYPDDQPRIEDPARSIPYEDELPGDTAPATEEDPDASLLEPPPTDTCIRIKNKGILSGDIVFENLICGYTVTTPPAADYGGQPTVSIIVVNAAGATVLSSIQASYASNPVEIEYDADPGVRQPEYSYGNCDSCTP